MMNATQYSGSHKRKYGQKEVYHDAAEECVDDLAFAAQYAIVDSIIDTPTTTHASNDDTPEIQPDIASATTEVSSKTAASKVDNKTVATSSDDESEPIHDVANDSSDDESDIDLREGIEKMIEDCEEEVSHQRSSKNGSGSVTTNIQTPKTQNEIDPYNCKVTDLEKELEMNLGIDAEELSDANKCMEGESTNIVMVKEDKLNIAGTIKNHLVSERIIVIESDATSISGAFYYNQNMNGVNGNSIIDEGSLLMVKVEKENGIEDYHDGIKQGYCQVILLGRVLEVFGPVSKPLYTLRITEIESATKSNKEDDPEPKTKVVVDQVIGECRECDNEKSSTQNENQDGSKIYVEEGTSGDGCLNISSSNDTKESFVKSGDDVTPKSKSSDEQEAGAIMNESSGVNEDGRNGGNDQVEDPWSEDGRYTKWIQSRTSVQVYFSNDQVKIVDTNEVVRNSKKGCDASNVYDEEVKNTNEMYFSDDEQEREAKRSQKKGKDARQHGRSRGNDSSSNSSRTVSNNRQRPRDQNYQQHHNMHQNMHHPIAYSNQMAAPIGQYQVHPAPQWGYQAQPYQNYNMGYTPQYGSNFAPPPTMPVVHQSPPPPPPPQPNNTYPQYPQHQQYGQPAYGYTNNVTSIPPPPPPYPQSLPTQMNYPPNHQSYTPQSGAMNTRPPPEDKK